MALISAFCAIPAIGDLGGMALKAVANGTKYVTKAAKAAKYLKVGTQLISYGGLAGVAGYNAYKGYQDYREIKAAGGDTTGAIIQIGLSIFGGAICGATAIGTGYKLSKMIAADYVGAKASKMMAGGAGKGASGSNMLCLPEPKGTNPWLEGADIVSMEAPKNCYIDMAMAPGQNKPGGWGTFDYITDVKYVRENLAVIPEFKPEIGYVQRYQIPKGTRIQVGTVGPQTYKGITYSGGGNQVQILNFIDRAKLIPIGSKRPIF